MLSCIKHLMHMSLCIIHNICYNTRPENHQKKRLEKRLLYFLCVHVCVCETRCVQYVGSSTMSALRDLPSHLSRWDTRQTHSANTLLLKTFQLLSMPPLLLLNSLMKSGHIQSVYGYFQISGWTPAMVRLGCSIWAMTRGPVSQLDLVLCWDGEHY